MRAERLFCATYIEGIALPGVFGVTENDFWQGAQVGMIDTGHRVAEHVTSAHLILRKSPYAGMICVLHTPDGDS